jgi:hypothetical protein
LHWNAAPPSSRPAFGVHSFCIQLRQHELGKTDLWSTAAYLRQYQIVAAEGRPVFSFDWMIGQFEARHPFQTGIWLLASDGRNVDMCISVEDYLKLRRAELEPSAVLQAF